MGKKLSFREQYTPLYSGELDWMLDSNDEEFSKFERGSKDFIGSLRDIPEGSAEGIALSLLGRV